MIDFDTARADIVGVLRADGTTGAFTEIAITSRAAREQLKRMGYDAGAVCSAWEDHGWAQYRTGRTALGKMAREYVWTPTGLQVAEGSVAE